MSKKLRLVTEEEGNLLAITANEWIAGPSGFMFSSTKSVAKYAVMEFLANEAGLTIYPVVIENQEKAENGQS